MYTFSIDIFLIKINAFKIKYLFSLLSRQKIITDVKLTDFINTVYRIITQMKYILNLWFVDEDLKRL